MYRIPYNKPHDTLVDRILKEIDNLKEEIIYYQDLSAVGCRYWIGENYLEEVVGGWYRWNKEKLTREQHEKIKPILAKMWQDTGRRFMQGER